MNTMLEKKHGKGVRERRGVTREKESGDGEKDTPWREGGEDDRERGLRGEGRGIEKRR